MRVERKIAICDIVIVCLIALAKIFSGSVFSSFALMVSGYYTLCVLTNKLLSFTASIVKGRRVSLKEPFGYGKNEMYSMMVYGLIICLLGLFIFIKTFFLKYYFVDLKIILPIIVSVLSLFIMSKILFKVAKSIQSEMLMDMMHVNFFDGIYTVLTIFFISLGGFIPVFDMLGALFGAILIFMFGLKIIENNFILVNGQNDLNKKIIKKVELALKECDGIYYSNCNLINIRNYYKVVIEILINDNVDIEDLIIWEEYVKGKIKLNNFEVKLVDFLVYKNN